MYVCMNEWNAYVGLQIKKLNSLRWKKKKKKKFKTNIHIQ